MKIAMIGHKDFPCRSGGVEVVVYALATRLAARGEDVTVYNRGRQRGHNRYRVEGVNVIRSFTFRRQSLNAMVYSFTATLGALPPPLRYHALSCDRSVRAARNCACVWQADGRDGSRTQLAGGQMARLCLEIYKARRAHCGEICRRGNNALGRDASVLSRHLRARYRTYSKCSLARPADRYRHYPREIRSGEERIYSVCRQDLARKGN